LKIGPKGIPINNLPISVKPKWKIHGLWIQAGIDRAGFQRQCLCLPAVGLHYFDLTADKSWWSGKIYLLKFVQTAGCLLFNHLYLFINIKFPNWHESCFNIFRPKCPAAPAAEKAEQT
jgi:hypothetical protein